MSQLHVSLLGSFQVAVDGTPVTGFAYDKARALFACLAVEADRAHRREALATLLWPELEQRAARHNLSQALLIVRKAIGDAEANPPWLLLDSESVRLNPAAAIQTDLGSLADLLERCEQHVHRRLEGCRACADRLEQVAALYRGDLLEDVSLPDALAFDEWVLVGRERVRRRVVAALSALAAFHLRMGNASQAAQVAQRLIDLEPWHEAGWRTLMLALATAGRRGEALDAFERCRRSLADELGIEPDAATLALAERIRVGTLEPASGGTHLPEQPTPFVGRAGELEALAAQLGDPDCRLLTLVGPGGIGKTRLALQLARTEAPAWADGVWFVALAGVRGPQQLTTAIGDALGAPLHGPSDPWEQLLDWLTDRELLIVLDNAEQLGAVSGLVADILERTQRVQLVVTSRERLSLRREWVVEVQGLSGDGGWQADAGRLFVQRARQSRPAFEPDAADQLAIERICRQTDGMPLAIEIAAAWVSVLTCQEIAGEIERGLDFLATTQRDMPTRHRSVRAVFDSSWERLGDSEQRAFRRISVFHGGFDRVAAERVAGVALAVLSALVGKSLLRRTTAGRYELHELLRQYGAERLAAAGDEAEIVGERHSRWYLELVAAQESRLKGPEQTESIADIRAEIENVRPAWLWAAERGHWELLAAAARALWLWWDLTGRYQEWESLLGSTLAALERGAGGAAEAANRWQHGALLALYGGALLRLGDMERGRAVIDRSIALVREGGDGHMLGLALNYRAMIARAEHDVAAERRDLRESIAAFDAADDRWGAAYSRNDLGALEDQAGDNELARRLQEESLAGFTALGDRRGMAFALTSLGVAAARRGDAAAALRALDESLRIRRQLENPWGIATSLIQLGIVARQSGDAAAARRCLLDALATAWAVRAVPVVIDATLELAELDLANGHRGAAIDMLAALREHPAATAEARQRATEALDTLGLQPPTEARALDALVRAVLAQAEPVAATSAD